MKRRPKNTNNDSIVCKENSPKYDPAKFQTVSPYDLKLGPEILEMAAEMRAARANTRKMTREDMVAQLRANGH